MTALRVLRLVARRPTGAFGLVWLGLLTVGAVVSLFWTPFDPQRTDPGSAWLLPFTDGHVLGTDRIGHDQFSQLLVGARETLVVAVCSALVAAVVGLALGLVAALGPRWVGFSAVALIDILVAFPTLLLAMVLAAVYGSSLGTVVVAIGIGFGVAVARVARAEITAVRGTDYVLAARVGGAGTGRIIRRHLLPNIAPTLIVQLSLVMALAVLVEAALTYLGYGSAPSSPSWGGMLHEQQAHIAARPLLVIWPGLAVALTVLAFNLLGDALREATDPRLVRTR
ncbi:Dipeptide transport system permease protein DppC [Actinokineospora spheciospongiae]|uniref:Dipeptide transport system permease protein DppC n=1 Tax=Actinokineospora spheciospongiae TaxID=909613 RepID=W7IH30_9PSEU|nr:ABC transporter permease [Actinokineospora spheciospongiae]EWC60190.1 Dipeptide transport system permease protein DppC [Actinokineospora spheciospongiae]